MRHAHILGSKDPLMHRLVPTLVAEMGEAYPELKRAEPLIAETLKLEEVRFREDPRARAEAARRIHRDDESGRHAPRRGRVQALRHLRFPRDLTEDALRERGMQVDGAGFDAAMARQRAEARKAWSGSGEAATDQLWFQLREELGPTEFLGYGTESAEGSILAILKDGQRAESAKAGETVRIITNQTPFYGEGGGQVGDRGAMFSAQGAEGTVTDTEKKLGNLHVHVVEVSHGEFKLGQAVELRVDAERRRATRANHSATHLLHAALKHVLGPHVAQKGSLVGPDRLRFDFSHPKAMSSDELKRVEDEVNEVVRQNSDVSTRLMPTAHAIEAGAVAMFGEKYGDEVRVLAMGQDLSASAKPYLGRIVRRHACAPARRYRAVHDPCRIRGRGGRAAHRSPNQRGRAALSRRAGGSGARGRRRAENLARRIAGPHHGAQRRAPPSRARAVGAKKALALAGPAKSGDDDPARAINGVKAILRIVEGVAAKDLKALADDAKAKLGSGVVAFITTADGKASLVVGVTPDLTARVSAVDLVRAGAEALGGKGRRRQARHGAGRRSGRRPRERCARGHRTAPRRAGDNGIAKTDVIPGERVARTATLLAVGPGSA